MSSKIDIIDVTNIVVKVTNLERIPSNGRP